MAIGTFREWLRESELNEAKEVYVIGDADGRVLSVKNNKFTFTSNNNLAYTFNSEKEAIDYEDKHSNDIDGLTYIYKMKNLKLVKVD